MSTVLERVVCVSAVVEFVVSLSIVLEGDLCISSVVE